MLWAECNWKVVSMSDLVSGPSVKKAYQRAILCVHPDKVQQKGANVKQKYIAEKVFDLLKDAYAKFNSEQY
jgi:DnaJ-class molecular chaperone